MKTVHGWQAVICPLCPKWKEQKTPSGLRKHIKKSHWGDSFPTVMLETALMYFFAVDPVHYRAISAVKAEESSDTRKALQMAERWAELVDTERSRRLYTTVLRDWTCHLGNQTSRKRKNETESAPKTKKVKEAPLAQKPTEGWDLTILNIIIRGKTSCSATLWSTVPGYVGRMEVDFTLICTPVRKVIRLIEGLQDSLQPAETVTEKRNICSSEMRQRISSALGITPEELLTISLADLASHLEAPLSPGPVPAMFSPQADTADILEMSARMAGIGRPSSSPSSSPTPRNTGHSGTSGLPDDAYEEDMEQCPPPSPPLPPFPDQDFTAVPDVPLPPPPPEFLTPLEPPQEQQVPEQAQTVSTSTSPLPHLPPPPSPPPPPPPSSQSLPPPSSSPPPPPPPPAANNMPLGIVMECPPALQPVPAIPEASLRQDPLAPRPPTVDRTGKPLPKQPQAMPSGDVELMKWGSWPLLSPGRRDWSNSSLQIAVPRSRITWPPKNWQVMSRQQRTFALQVVAAMVAMGDEEPGNFPLKSPETLMEEFNMLALPGTGTNHGHDPVALAQRQLHSALKHSSRTDPKAHQGMLNLLQQGRAAGPRARNDLLRQVNLNNVPVVPYHKGQRQETVPAYSPSRPGLEE